MMSGRDAIRPNPRASEEKRQASGFGHSEYESPVIRLPRLSKGFGNSFPAACEFF
jgi:hypothetical protein